MLLKPQENMQKRIRKSPTSSFHLILNPDNKFGSYVTKFSNKITKNYPSTFILDNKEYKPHITLYLFSAPIKNIKKIIDKVKIFSHEIEEIEIKIDKLVLSDGWIMIDLDNSGKLLKYHKTAIRLINSLREGVLREKYRAKKSIDTLKKSERAVLLKYGDKHSMEYFHPHTSLTHFEDLGLAKSVFEKFKNTKLPKKMKIKSLELIRTVGNESGGIGRVLFKKDLN